MGQKDLNKMIGEYLDSRRSKTPAKKQSRTKNPFSDDPKNIQQISSNKVHIVHGDESWVDKIIRKIAGPQTPKKEKEKEEIIEDETTFLEEEKEYLEEVTPSSYERFKAWLQTLFAKPATFTSAEIEEGMKEEAREIIEKEDALLAKEEAIAEEERVLEAEKAGFMRRLFLRFGFVQEKEEEPPEEEYEDEQPDEDLKEIAKIATTVMRMLPRRKFDSFRESEDFIKFKEILDRRGLLKK